MKRNCKNLSYAWIILIVFCLMASSEVFGETWGPLLTTNWHQGDHYNRKCPLISPGSSSRCAVGCVATAMGQIINMWNYPSSVSFSPLPWPQGDSYTSRGNAGHIDIDGDAVPRDFPELAGDRPGMPSLNTALAIIDYNGDPEEEAYLCFGVGVKVQMRYGSQSEVSRLSDSVYRNGFNYGSAILDYSASDLWSIHEDRVIENIKKGRPVQIAIIKSGSMSGHSVVVDGYRDSDGYFHVNMGWRGTSEDTWYDLPNIGDYDSVIQLVYDISPYQGWSQWGADEKNTFHAVYSAPTANPPVDKWQVTSRIGWRMRGLVVGTGNKIYASCSWAVMGYANPYILEIDEYGVVENEIEIPKEGGASYPVQSKNGEIFVAVKPPGDPGRIYKIEPWLDKSTPTLYFSEPQGQGFSHLKVDPAGWLYACARDNLYCIKSPGNPWTFSAPAGSWFLGGPPAIDIERNLVYISSYNISTDTAYLTCLNRNNGQLACSLKVFPNVTKDIGTPLIGPDGTVYVGCKTTLYALEAFVPGYALLDLWQITPGISYITQAPTIAEDGTIYLPYRKNDTDYFVGAFDSANKGNMKWEISLPPVEPNDYVNVKDLYTTSNKVIVFFVHKQVLHDDDIEPWAESSYILYAYRDNGSSYEYLWEKDFGATGGLQAFGPGATIYVIPQTGDENTLYAISEGARGDPDGGGMGYTDNAAPLIPSNPGPPDEAQDVNSTVTLSWACSDPEGHDRKYSLFVGESGYDMVPVATDLTDEFYTLLGLKPGTGYAWKIIGTDGQAVTEGPTWVFATLAAMYHPADPNNDYVISMLEILAYIDQWAVGNVSMLEVLEGIDLWAAGQYYWDPVDEKFKPGEP